MRNESARGITERTGIKETQLNIGFDNVEGVDIKKNCGPLFRIYPPLTPSKNICLNIQSKKKKLIGLCSCNSLNKIINVYIKYNKMTIFINDLFVNLAGNK